MITAKPCSAARSRASAPWSNPRHRSVVIITSVPTWRVMKPTSRSRRIGMSGFCTAPSRASATITTIVSSVVGSCHETIVPVPTPRRGEVGGDAGGGVAQLAPGERAAVVVGEQHVVGPLVGGLLDQCPHGRRVRRDLVHAALTVTCLSESGAATLDREPRGERGHPTCGAATT